MTPINRFIFVSRINLVCSLLANWHLNDLDRHLESSIPPLPYRLQQLNGYDRSAQRKLKLMSRFSTPHFFRACLYHPSFLSFKKSFTKSYPVDDISTLQKGDYVWDLVNNMQTKYHQVQRVNTLTRKYLIEFLTCRQHNFSVFI